MELDELRVGWSRGEEEIMGKERQKKQKAKMR